MVIGNKIKKLRKKFKLTREELGDKVRLNGGNAIKNSILIRRFEEGTEKPTDKQLKKIANYFDKSVSYFESDDFTRKYPEKPQNKEYFNLQLRKLWKQSGLTQVELADEIGIPRKTLNNYLCTTTKHIPNKGYFNKICSYFNVAPNYFQKEDIKYYTTKELAKRWSVPIKIISPYTSIYKNNNDTNIKMEKVSKNKKQNLIPEDEIENIYEMLPNKYKSNKDETKQEEGENYYQRFINKVDKIDQRVNGIENCLFDLEIPEKDLFGIEDIVKYLDWYVENNEYGLNKNSDQLCKLEDKIEKLENELEKTKNEKETKKSFWNQLKGYFN